MNGSIIVSGCKKCGRCDSVCNTGALERIDGTTRINHEKCNACARCVVTCPNKAIMLFE